MSRIRLVRPPDLLVGLDLHRVDERLARRGVVDFEPFGGSVDPAKDAASLIPAATVEPLHGVPVPIGLLDARLLHECRSVGNHESAGIGEHPQARQGGPCRGVDQPREPPAAGEEGVGQGQADCRAAPRRALASLGDEERAMKVARRIRTGQIDVNGGAFNPCAPFGGVGASGHGRELGAYGLEEFFYLKSIQR